MTGDYLALQEEAHHLAQQLFGNEVQKRINFVNRLLAIYTGAQGKDFLLIHNPGGWGSTTLEHCLAWERSMVEGVSTTMNQLGHTCLLIQYFRSGSGWREYFWDIREQFRFFATKARIMATELEFITRHLSNLKVILMGASQGAAFTNAVTQQLTKLHQVYSIELGMFFPYISRRVITERTLVLDSNGLVPDAAVRRDIMAGARAYLAAPFRWMRHWLERRPVKFTHCINVRGHDYDWNYPQVQRQIIDFLETNFGTTTK